MGGRQSSQGNPTRQNTPSDGNSSRYSIGSFDNESSSTPVSGRTVLFSGPSANVELSGGAGVVRRRRRRDRNDYFIETHSLPAHFFPSALLTDIKCPVCSKRIGSNEVDSHLLVCLAKPKVSYNEDILTTDAGECIICLDDMCKGDRIARLQCLCIYHKQCLDEWFQRNRCCPEHPEQAPQEYMETLPRNTSRSNRLPISPRLAVANNSNNRTDSNNIEGGETLQLPPLVTSSLPANISSGEHSPLHLIDDTDMSPSASTSSFVTAEEGGFSGLQSTHTSLSAMSNCNSPDSGGSPQRTMVHVDEGSIHGSPSLFDEEDLVDLTSKKLKLLVAENSVSSEIDNT